MPAWLEVDRVDLPRGRSLHYLLDISSPWRVAWKLAVAYRGRVYATLEGLTREEIIEEGRVQETMPGPDGDSSWNAVLGRLTGRAPEPAGVWEGSFAEYAARQFPLGSWEWVVTLKAYRELQKQKQSDRGVTNGNEQGGPPIGPGEDH